MLTVRDSQDNRSGDVPEGCSRANNTPPSPPCDECDHHHPGTAVTRRGWGPHTNQKSQSQQHPPLETAGTTTTRHTSYTPGFKAG